MALNIAVVVLILAVTFLNSIFGLFSGLLNLFCCIVSACVAFGFSEALTGWLTGDFGLSGAYVNPLALGGLYIITLLVLRLAADTLIRGNVHVPMYVDWGGGALCGFLVAELSIGMLVLSFTMLPFGGRAATYERFRRTDEIDSRTERVVFTRGDVWFKPDSFAAGLFNILSNGSLKGRTTFDSVYPDYPEWVSWTSNTVQSESSPTPQHDQSNDGYKNGLRVTEWWEETSSVAAQYRKEKPTHRNRSPSYGLQDFTPESGMKLLGFRLELARAAADAGKNVAPNHRFRPSMIRLVGSAAGRPKQYIPRILGGADSALGGEKRIVDIDNNFSIPAEGATSIDAFFEVDRDFRPSFVEYRRYARAAVTAKDSGEGAPGEELRLERSGGSGRGPEVSGTTGFMGAVLERSGDNKLLPFAMRQELLARGGGTDVAAEGAALVSGRCFGLAKDFEPKNLKDRFVNSFAVPQGYRLCQIRFSPRQANSLPGQVFNFVARTVNQYRAVDSEGTEYLLVGYYGLVQRGADNYIELFYTGQAEDPAFRGMLDFQHIQPQELTSSSNAVVGLFFLVPPGKTIVRIQNQAGAGFDNLEFKMKDR
ncbi:MAG: CvpA family protein [Planctomycetes bacterium]|nr:CvpA family protein [Planctomycetota bacterium]